MFDVAKSLTTVSRRLKTSEAASYIGCSESTLAKLRVYGGGPIYIKVGKRRVVYDLRDLDEWMSDRRIAATSAKPKSTF